MEKKRTACRAAGCSLCAWTAANPSPLSPAPECFDEMDLGRYNLTRLPATRSSVCTVGGRTPDLGRLVILRAHSGEQRFPYP
jgi:hypothetical protein